MLLGARFTLRPNTILTTLSPPAHFVPLHRPSLLSFGVARWFLGEVAKTMPKKKELLSKAPWRGDDDDSDKFSDARLKVTKESGDTATMHVPRRRSKHDSPADDDDDSLVIDPQLRYSFQRNYQFIQRVFSIDTLVKPLPPAMAYNVSRNLSFFTRIFTQFFDPEGIANAQKSLGLGQEEKARRVR